MPCCVNKEWPEPMTTARDRVPLHLLIPLLGLLAVAAPGQAQQVYRMVTPDGRITFSDVPPPDAKEAPPPRAADAQAAPALPYALRQVVQRFPVTFYSSPTCAPCDAGRALLTARGVPFTERSVATAADAQALQRLSGEPSVPLLVVGQQHLRGFSSTEWHQYLDAAGYPSRSALPAGWRPAPATPLAPPTAAEAVPVPRAAPAPAPAPPAASTRPPAGAERAANPAGIQF